MPKFRKKQPEIVVSAYRPGINGDPSWAKKRPPKGFKQGDWVVKEGNAAPFAVSKAKFTEQYELIS